LGVSDYLTKAPLERHKVREAVQTALRKGQSHDDELVKRYRALVEQKYQRVLSPSEVNELEELSERLDDLDEPFYRPIINRLQEALDKKEQGTG
jgi:hypothetical protein